MNQAILLKILKWIFALILGAITLSFLFKITPYIAT